jgi:tripeptidyl-peptidase-2
MISPAVVLFKLEKPLHLLSIFCISFPPFFLAFHQSNKIIASISIFQYYQESITFHLSMRLIMRIRMMLLVCTVSTFAFAQRPTLSDHPWNFLDNKTIGAFDFIRTHPSYDGRGVVIIICDSGVDMSVPGLIKTSEDKVKVIDAQDFSGQTDIPLKKAEFDTVDGERRIKAKDIHLIGFDHCEYKPEDGIYWLGGIDEKKYFQNSGVTDINNNGNHNDFFTLMTFPVTKEGEKRWVYYVDENADGRIDDDRPRFDYRFYYDSFTLRGREADKQKALLTFVLNIRPDEKIASLHTCDNAHGTHCAGIAAGYHLFNEPGLNGIAPGAQVISCKIGDGTLSGGATRTGSMKKAYDYGVKWAQDHHVPVVFSMSYGIGSEIEGHSDIEKYLNKLMAENENIVIVTSNGNSGPGLSTAGNPACASRVLSAGALLSPGSARDTYGFTTEGNRIFLFSSRGGETAKPDCIAPGAAASTVPAYAKNENMWGTSMACPQLAGAAALLISACVQEKIPFNGTLIKRALKYSASPLPGYTPLDQGTGIVNISKAFEIMKIYAQRREVRAVLDYESETKCPVYEDEKGTAAYWRTGHYIPSLDEKQTFKVKAIFSKEITADQKQNFYRAFDLQVDQPWFKLDKSSTYIRADHSASIGGYYQRDLLRQPGLYVCTISAFPKSGPGGNVPDFELLNTIIVPYEFNSGNDYRHEFANKTLAAGECHRYFLLIPPAASAMNIKVSPSPGRYCGVRGYIFNPEGSSAGSLPEMNRETNSPIRYTCSGKNLASGIWEVDIAAYYNVPQTSTYNMLISFDGFQIDPGTVTKIEYKNGEKPGGHITLLDNFKCFKGSITGQLNGYMREQNVTIKKDEYRYCFKMDVAISDVKFEISMDKETWNLFTDVSAVIKDSSDKILASDAFEQRTLELGFKPPSPAEYKLMIIGGYTDPAKKDDEWHLKIIEKYFNREAIMILFKDGKYQIYPNVAKMLKFNLESSPRMVPDGFLHFGEIKFNDQMGGTAAQVDILFEK